uniref:Probable transporter MCH1 n=1 Tax=Cyberlindnera americana TaxID=36016 RepID=A0A5P8N8L7_9ASCO|nr:MFS transporter [Cyberlindnera americana]
MALSALETNLTKHVRALLEQHPIDSLKKFTFTISLLSCLCAGSVLLFPLFTPVLHNEFGYTQFEINIVGSFTSLGMYLFLPVLGYLADCHGPAILSVIAVLFFAPGYTVASLVITNNWNYWILAASFCVIGCATSAFYFACLLSCAKIYPKNKGLTISAPVTCYGLSSLIGAQLLKCNFLKSANGELDLFITFRFFSVLYLFLGIFNFVSSCVVTIERDVLLRKSTPSTEDSPLLEGESENDDLVKNHKSKFKLFLKDISAYILLICFLFTIGPSEMYITNMGSIIQTTSPLSSISNQVSIHAVFSTIARLSLGGLSDFLVNKYSLSRIWLLLIIMILGAITQVIISTSLFIGEDFYIISALSGFVYGGLFTIFPTIVLSIWGAELFGSAYGFYMLSPAIGSSSFGMLYGVIYDAGCTTLESALTTCISPVFWITAISYSFSSVLLVIAWRCLWSKRQDV